MFGIEHRGRIGAAKKLIVHARKAAIHDEPDDPILLQPGDHRIEVGNCIDLAVPHRSDGRRPASNSDERCVSRTETRFCHEVQNEKVGRRLRCRHPDPHAFEVGGRIVRPVLAYRENDPREAAQFDKRANVLSFGLHTQRVLIGAGHDVGRTGEQGIKGLGAAFEIGNRDVQAIISEVTAAFRQRERQIVEVRLLATPSLTDGLSIC